MRIIKIIYLLEGNLMKKLLFIALAIAPLIQASITQEDAEAILNEIGTNMHYPAESSFEQKAHFLTQFAKACAFDTPDMTLTFNWYGRTGYNSYSPRSINCSQLAEVMEKIVNRAQEYDLEAYYESDSIDRLKRSIDEIRPAK